MCGLYCWIHRFRSGLRKNDSGPSPKIDESFQRYDGHVEGSFLKGSFVQQFPPVAVRGIHACHQLQSLGRSL